MTRRYHYCDSWLQDCDCEEGPIIDNVIFSSKVMPFTFCNGEFYRSTYDFSSISFYPEKVNNEEVIINANFYYL